MIEMLEQGVGIGVRGHPIGGDVLVDLAFHRLPSIGPEPTLVGRDRQNGLELDHAVFTLDDPDLRPGFIKVHAAAKLGRQGDGPARLDRDEMALHVGMQHSSDAASLHRERSAIQLPRRLMYGTL